MNEPIVKINIQQKRTVCVLTPSMNHKFLSKAIESVQKQTYKDIEHLIVFDGVKNTIARKKIDNVKTLELPYNTGKNGFYGHRIYAAIPLLLDFDYVFFLDEDNWYDGHHVESLIDLIEKEKLDWAHSLRKVYTIENGLNFLDVDCCEAIGRYPIWFTTEKEEKDYLVDTSTFAFRGDFIKQVSTAWYSGWGGDRRFFKIIKDRSKYNTTGFYTLNYILPPLEKAYGGDKDFFKKGNEYVKNYYGGVYPWEKIK